jgi:hypothetical protein
LKFIFTIIKKGTKIRIIVNQNNPRNDSIPGMLNVGIFNVGFQTQAAVAHSALGAGGFSQPTTDAKIPPTPKGWTGFWE